MLAPLGLQRFLIVNQSKRRKREGRRSTSTTLFRGMPTHALITVQTALGCTGDTPPTLLVIQNLLKKTEGVAIFEAFRIGSRKRLWKAY